MRELLALQAHELAQALRVELRLSEPPPARLRQRVLLLLKLMDALGERALEPLDLRTELLDLLALPEALLRVLLHGLLVEGHLAPQLLALLLEHFLRLLQRVRLSHLQPQLLRHPSVLEEDLLRRRIESLDGLLLR